MTLKNLEDRWRKNGDAIKGGAQAESFPVEEMSTGRAGFAKVLRQQRNERARRRFYREVAAYRTLEGAEVPRLLDDNADLWNQGDARLYMVTEFIDGSTLDDWIRSHGPMLVDQSLELCYRLLEILGQAHSQDIVHRDIKPRNIILRGDDSDDPVLLDFGLMFSKADVETDLTLLGEEVGNRFFRLPEHSLGGRSPVSDITQSFAVMLYAITGMQPQVLVDGAGRGPHQRSPFRDALEKGVSAQVGLKLMRLLDRAFALRVDDRIPTVPEAIVGIKSVMTGGSDADDDADLDAKVLQILQTGRVAEIEVAQQAITLVLSRLAAIARQVASRRNLQCVQGGQSVSPKAQPPEGVTSLAIFDAELGQPTPLPQFKVTLIGEEAVVDFREESVWREYQGGSLEDSVTQILLRDYLRRRNELSAPEESS